MTPAYTPGTEVAADRLGRIFVKTSDRDRDILIVAVDLRDDR